MCMGQVKEGCSDTGCWGKVADQCVIDWYPGVWQTRRHAYPDGASDQPTQHGI